MYIYMAPNSAPGAPIQPSSTSTAIIIQRWRNQKFTTSARKTPRTHAQVQSTHTVRVHTHARAHTHTHTHVIMISVTVSVTVTVLG